MFAILTRPTLIPVRHMGTHMVNGLENNYRHTFPNGIQAKEMSFQIAKK
jgi:hypothetical protein